MPTEGSQEFSLSTPEIKTFPNGTRAKKLTIGYPPADTLNQIIPEMLAHDPNTILTDFRGMNIERLNQQQKALREAKTVIYNTMIGGGLGDSIESLRYALIAARYLTHYSPDAKFYIQAHSQILGMDRNSLNLPSNVTLIGEDEHVDYTPTATFAMKVLHGYEDLDETRISRQSAIEEKVVMSTLGVSTSNAIDENTRFTRADFDNICQLVSLGIPVTQTDLRRSILKTPETREKKYDIVIAPDAKEISDGTRSKKSLSTTQWENVFREIAKHHPGARIGIVQGIAHPEYCHTVFEYAQKAGLEVTEEITQTLTDFLHVLERTNTFFGMDSGTTHLASELALANQHLSVREIFFSDNMFYALNHYGIRGPQTEIFYILGKDFFGDLQYTTDDIADFIAA